MPSSCTTCNSPNAKSVCSRCKCTYYCNVACQRKDWQRHKNICKSLNKKHMKEKPHVLNQPELPDRENNQVLQQPPKQTKKESHSQSHAINVTIKKLTQDPPITILINPTDTTRDIKLKIQNAWGHEPKHQMLLCAGAQFKDDDDRPLMESHPRLTDGSTVHLVLRKGGVKKNKPKPAPTFSPCSAYSGQIFVKSLSGFEHTLDVTSADTIQNIKHKIQNKGGSPPEMQRLLFGGTNLCPQATLEDLGIANKSTIHMVLKLGAGATPPDSLLNAVYFESFCWWNLYESVQDVMNIEFDFNLAKIICDYTPLVHLNAKKVHPKCMAAAGRSERDERACPFCKGYKWDKPYIDSKQIEQNTLLLRNKGYDGFYGLFFVLEFKTYRAVYNNTWTIQTDIDAVNKQNIEEYVQIVDKVNNIPLAFELYDRQLKTTNAQWITIMIDENSVRRQEIQKLFKNDKLEVNVLIKEESLPAIYGGQLNDKGPIVGDVNLQYFIYRV
eukprot:56998_1